jgi:Ni/Fe-hydrogenase subunit HybB-like protein
VSATAIVSTPPAAARRFGFWTALFIVLIGLLIAATWLRFTRGLGLTTNLSDHFPWGLWIGFDVLSRVGLAAGAFTLAGTVHILNLKRFEPIVRPAVLTGFLCYLTVVGGLTFELGQPWRIWHTIIFWNPHSVLFEVAWCVMLYTNVMLLELSPALFERLGWKRPTRLIHAVYTPVVIAGVLLSTLHQSSLGSLYLIVPSKLHPLWYSPLLPAFFFLSAIAAGLGMVIVEFYLFQRAYGRPLPMDLLEPLGRVMAVVLGLYGLLRLIVLQRNGALAGLRHPGYEGGMFLFELVLGVILPVILLFNERVRRAPGGLVAAAFLAILGFVAHRLNVSVTGMERAAGGHYVPSAIELLVSVGLVALAFGLFALAARFLPIFETEPAAHEA